MKNAADGSHTPRQPAIELGAITQGVKNLGGSRILSRSDGLLEPMNASPTPTDALSMTAPTTTLWAFHAISLTLNWLQSLDSAGEYPQRTGSTEASLPSASQGDDQAPGQPTLDDDDDVSDYSSISDYMSDWSSSSSSVEPMVEESEQDDLLTKACKVKLLVLKIEEKRRKKVFKWWHQKLNHDLYVKQVRAAGLDIDPEEDFDPTTPPFGLTLK